MNIAHIVAISRNGCIGNDNALPWRIGSDLKRFRQLTSGSVVIMGRKTFESLNSKPLPNRINIVLTRDANFKAEGVEAFDSIENAIRYAQEVNKTDTIWIIGGSEIYTATEKYVNKLYITEVSTRIWGDAYYNVDIANYTAVKRDGPYTDTLSGLEFSYIDYEYTGNKLQTVT